MRKQKGIRMIYIPVVLAQGPDKIFPFAYSLTPHSSKEEAWTEAYNHAENRMKDYIDSFGDDYAKLSYDEEQDKLILFMCDESIIYEVCQHPGDIVYNKEN